MRIAVFDLDGTLLDTLDDLHAAVNRALAKSDFPLRSREEIRTFVGDGVALLIRRALPHGVGEAAFLSCLSDFKADYATACDVRTEPYEGIVGMLRALRAAGIKIAVVSNKFDTATKQLCTRYFSGLTDVAVGERESDGVRKKPFPDTVFEALETLGASPDDPDTHAVYIGDSEVDIATATNAGLPCISVTWGFRDADLLRAHGATTLADTPDAVLKILTE